MKAYKFLYYKLYCHWLKRKNGKNSAHVDAILAITMLLSFNIGDIMFIIIYFKHLNLPSITPFVKFLLVLFLILLGIVNYFLLAYKKKYLAISDEFEKLPLSQRSF